MFRFIKLAGGLNHLLVFAVTYSIFAFAFYVFARRYFVAAILTAGFIVACGAVGMGGPTTTLYLLFSFLTLGWIILGGGALIAIPDSTDLILSTFLGAVCYMTLIGVSAAFPMHYPVVYMMLLAAPIIAAPKIAMLCLSRLAEIIYSWEWEDGWSYAGFSVMTFVLAIYLFYALLPDINFDALTQHLTVPTSVAFNHYWSFDFHKYVFAVMPLGAEWIYTMGYLLGGEFAAHLINLSFFILVALLLWQVIRPWLGERTSWLVAALYVSTPFFGLETRSLLVDNFLVAYLFSSAVALSLAHDKREKKYLYLAVALSAAALAVKTPGVFIVAVICGMSIYSLLTTEKTNRLKTLFIGGIIFFVVGIYPYCIAYALTKNPVFPFMNAIFKSPYFDSSVSFRDMRWHQSLGITSLYNLTFKTHNFLESRDGVFGFQYLILIPLALLSVGTGYPYIGWVSLMALLAFVPAIFHFTGGYLRYLYPALSFVTILAALALKQIKILSEKLFSLVCLALYVMLVLNFAFIPNSQYGIADFPLYLVFSPQRRTRYVQNLAPQRAIISYINARYGPSIRVCFLSDPFSAGFSGDAILADWHGPQFNNRLTNARSPEAIFKLMQQEGISHFVASKSQSNMSTPVWEFLKKFTRTEYRVGDVYLARLKKKYIFYRELLVNGNFYEGFKGWTRSGRVIYKHSSHVMMVNVDNALTQQVPVNDKFTYRYSITARCPTPNTYVRIQVNWMCKKGFCGTTILPQKCGPRYKVFSANLTPFPGAVYGGVYVSGHGKEPIEVKSISFAQ
jgi:hypothetical protein